MSKMRDLLNRNGPAYAFAGAACLGCMTVAIEVLGSIRLLPEDRALAQVLGIMVLGVTSYLAAGLWFVPKPKRAKEFSKLDVWRFAEFAAAGLGGWVGFWASALVWNLLLGETYSYVAWLVFAMLAILPTGFGSVHGVFVLHAFVHKLRAR